LTIPAVGEAQKPDRAAKLDAVCVFSRLLRILLKISVRQKHKYGFFSKISNVMVCFCHSQSILPCLLDPGMFSLAF